MSHYWSSATTLLPFFMLIPIIAMASRKNKQPLDPAVARRNRMLAIACAVMAIMLAAGMFLLLNRMPA